MAFISFVKVCYYFNDRLYVQCTASRSTSARRKKSKAQYEVLLKCYNDKIYPKKPSRRMQSYTISQIFLSIDTRIIITP